MAEFGLAIGRKHKEQDETCFVDVTSFGRLAEIVQEYAKKGKRVACEGRLHLDQWADRESGQKRSAQGADSIVLLEFSDRPQQPARCDCTSGTAATGEQEIFLMVMRLSLHEIGIEPNDDGFIEGIQCGREARIQEWRDKQESREYALLFRRLQQRNYARRAQTRRPEALRANQHRYRNGNRERVRALEYQRRKAKYEAAPVVNQCEECGHVWEVAYEKRRKRSRFCSPRCKNRWHGKRRKRGRGLRDMSIKQRAIRFLEQNPGSTTKQIAEGIGAKPSSLATCLCLWTKEEMVRREGKGTAIYFAANVSQ